MLLAAGLGTRLRPLTDTVPKCLVPVAGRPLLMHWESALLATGVDRVRINTHHLPDPVRRFAVEASARSAIRWETVHEPTLLGSAGTIAANADFANGAETLLIVYADNLSDIDLAAMLAAHRAGGQPMTMALFRATNPRACGIATLDPGGVVSEFVEKPEQPRGDLANAGVYALTPQAWQEVVEMDAFDLGFDVLPRFVGRMLGFPIEGYHRDIGTPEALAEADRIVRARSAGVPS
jgi:mannose-1-phosphate guanylyltransferase